MLLRGAGGGKLLAVTGTMDSKFDFWVTYALMNPSKLFQMIHEASNLRVGHPIAWAMGEQFAKEQCEIAVKEMKLRIVN